MFKRAALAALREITEGCEKALGYGASSSVVGCPGAMTAAEDAARVSRVVETWLREGIAATEAYAVGVKPESYIITTPNLVRARELLRDLTNDSEAA